MVTTSWKGGSGRELNEGHQKVQTSSNKINKYYECNIQQDTHN